MVSNVWRRGYNPLYDNMLRTYADVFATLHVLESAREVNNLVFALPQARIVSREQFAARSQRVAQRGNTGLTWDNWSWRAMRRGPCFVAAPRCCGMCRSSVRLDAV